MAGYTLGADFGPLYGTLDLVGSAVGTTSDLVDLVDLVKRARVHVSEAQCWPLAMAKQSLTKLGADRIIGRVVLEIEGEA